MVGERMGPQPVELVGGKRRPQLRCQRQTRGRADRGCLSREKSSCPALPGFPGAQIQRSRSITPKPWISSVTARHRQTRQGCAFYCSASRNRTPGSPSVPLKSQITASVQREKPIHFLVCSISAAPKLHCARADEPTVPEPIRIVCHSSGEIPQSTRSRNAAAVRPPWRLSAGVGEALAPQFAPASSVVLSVPPRIARYI
jgi:hypothetical protein